MKVEEKVVIVIIKEHQRKATSNQVAKSARIKQQLYSLIS